MKIENVVGLIALGIGGYILYRVFSSGANALGAGVNTATQGIANAYVELTSPNAPVPQGSVMMPDGSSFPASQLTSMGFGFSGNTALFTGSDGNTYQLWPQSGGNYQATPY